MGVKRAKARGADSLEKNAFPGSNIAPLNRQNMELLALESMAFRNMGP